MQMFLLEVSYADTAERPYINVEIASFVVKLTALP